MKIFFLILVALALASCNFTSLFGGPPQAASSAPGVNPKSVAAIDTFTIPAAANPSVLTSDVTANIDNANSVIIFSVPYKVIDQALSLTPTVTIPTGASINISGPQNFSQPVTYQVTSADGSKTKTYKTQVGTTATSIAYLSVTGPFYVDSGGNPVPITDGVLTNPTPTTISLAVPPAEFASIANSKLGYAQISIPPNSQYSVPQLVAVSSGAVAPYPFTITSSDGSYSKPYSLQLASQNSTSGQLLALVANVQYQQIDSYNKTYNPSSALAFVNSTTFNVVHTWDPSFYILIGALNGNNGHPMHPFQMGSNNGGNNALPNPSFNKSYTWAQLTSSSQTLPAQSGAVTIFDDNNEQWGNVQTAWSFNGSVVAAYTDANVPNFLTGPTVNIATTISLVPATPIAISPNFIDTFAPTAAAPLVDNSQAVTDFETTSIQISQTFSQTLQGQNPNSGSASWYYSNQGAPGGLGPNRPGADTDTQIVPVTPSGTTLAFPSSGLHTYSVPAAANYYSIVSVVATKPAGTTFTNVILSSNLVSGYVINGNTLTFNFVPPAAPFMNGATPVLSPKQVGLAGVFTITPQTGTPQTYAVNIQ